MGEEEFWLHLEYRIGAEFAGLDDKALRYWWCDGFIPEGFEIDDGGACVTGRVWMAYGERQENWSFRLTAGKGVICREEVDWAKLLPADDVTGWLTCDWAGRHMTIEPELRT